MKKIPTKKIQIKKIKCIDLFLEETSDLTSIHPEMHEIFVSLSFQEKEFFKLEVRKFHFSKYNKFFQSVFFLIFRAGKVSPRDFLFLG